MLPTILPDYSFDKSSNLRLQDKQVAGLFCFVCVIV